MVGAAPWSVFAIPNYAQADVGTDHRIRFGVPIIGCPDYLSLMEHRADQQGILLDAPHFPEAFRELVKHYDPIFSRYASRDPQMNPFIGKRVLVLCGQCDELVPWSASRTFVEDLEVGDDGVKEVKVYAKVGHVRTPEMEDDACLFVRRFL